VHSVGTKDAWDTCPWKIVSYMKQQAGTRVAGASAAAQDEEQRQHWGRPVSSSSKGRVRGYGFQAGELSESLGKHPGYPGHAKALFRTCSSRNGVIGWPPGLPWEWFQSFILKCIVLDSYGDASLS
jgi:hypothetical protein